MFTKVVKLLPSDHMMAAASGFLTDVHAAKATVLQARDLVSGHPSLL